jgi:hypothetical protein
MMEQMAMEHTETKASKTLRDLISWNFCSKWSSNYHHSESWNNEGRTEERKAAGSSI